MDQCPFSRQGIRIRRLTRCPAKMHNDSLSTASLRFNTLSSIRVIVTSSSDGLECALDMTWIHRVKSTYLPAGFVLARCHGWDLWVYCDYPFVRPFGRRFDHLSFNLGKNTFCNNLNTYWKKGVEIKTNRVFPSEHSTQPRSSPKVKVGWRISMGSLPSCRKDSLRLVYKNSFSGIEGDGGLIIRSDQRLRQKNHWYTGCWYLRFFKVFGAKFPDQTISSFSLSLPAMVRLITHNLLACHVKGCTTNNFPLQFRDVQIELREAEFNPDFLKGFMPKLEWKALVDASRQVRHFIRLPWRIRFETSISWVIPHYHRICLKCSTMTFWRTFITFCLRYEIFFSAFPGKPKAVFLSRSMSRKAWCRARIANTIIRFWMVYRTWWAITAIQ